MTLPAVGLGFELAFLPAGTAAGVVVVVGRPLRIGTTSGMEDPCCGIEGDEKTAPIVGGV